MKFESAWYRNITDAVQKAGICDFQRQQTRFLQGGERKAARPVMDKRLAEGTIRGPFKTRQEAEICELGDPLVKEAVLEDDVNTDLPTGADAEDQALAGFNGAPVIDTTVVDELGSGISPAPTDDDVMPPGEATVEVEPETTKVEEASPSLPPVTEHAPSVVAEKTEAVVLAAATPLIGSDDDDDDVVVTTKPAKAKAKKDGK